MDHQTILATVENRTATVILNCPEYSSASAREPYVEIASAMKDLGSRRDVGSIVVIGAGRYFSIGGDIKRSEALIDSKEYLDGDSAADADNMSIAIRECPKPVTVMINGVAADVDLSYAFACDFWVMAPSSKMIMAFINMGLCGDMGNIYNLIRLIGPDKAELLMTTGDAYCREDCVRIGLATFLAEEGRLQKTIYNLASKLTGGFSAAHTGQRCFIKEYFYGGLAGFVADEGKGIAMAPRLSDFAEAIDTFLEKRTPGYNK